MGGLVQFDVSGLDHLSQLHFYEQLKDPNKRRDLETDAIYKVFYDRMKEDFLLVKIDVVIHKY